MKQGHECCKIYEVTVPELRTAVTVYLYTNTFLYFVFGKFYICPVNFDYLEDNNLTNFY